MTGNLLDHRTVQGALVRFGVLDAIDGIWGQKSAAAARLIVKRRVPAYRVEWPDARVRIALEQLLMSDASLPVGTIDGLVGPQTKFALERWQDRARDIDPEPAQVAHMPTRWPRQADVERVFGKPGENIITVTMPYARRLSWDLATKTSKAQFNKLCAPAFIAAHEQALAHYGYEGLVELGLDITGGTFNNRLMRGGRRPSMHAYGIAEDTNPDRNGLRTPWAEAQMSKPEYAAFVDAFYAQGIINLGKEANRDAMHFQAARL